MNNIGLTGSFAIGGLVLLTLIYIFFKFTLRQQTVALGDITQQSLTNVGRIVEYDFDKIGYRVSGGQKITSIDTFSISFLSDLDNDGTTDSVSYYRTIDSSGTHLYRRTSQGQNSTWFVNISELFIQGFDSASAATYTPANIRSILIRFVLDNNALSSDTTQNIGAYWQKRFFPKNL